MLSACFKHLYFLNLWFNLLLGVCVFQVNDITEGGGVKLRGEVCKTQLKMCKGVHPNVDCDFR